MQMECLNDIHMAKIVDQDIGVAFFLEFPYRWRTGICGGW